MNDLRTQTKESVCLIVGNYWGAVPETLSNYSGNKVLFLEKIYSANRKILDQLMFFDTLEKIPDTGDIKCLYLISPVNKMQLNQALIKLGWVSTQIAHKESNFVFYKLQNFNP